MNTSSPSTEILDKQSSKKKRERQIPSWLTKAVTYLTGFIITIPIFIILHQYIPEIELVIEGTHKIRLDYILSFIVIYSIIILLLNIIRRIVFGLAVMILIVLIINSFRNKYSFNDVYQDYKSLVIYLTEEPIKVPFLPESANFRDAEKIRSAIMYDDPVVRNRAIVLSMKNFSDDYFYRKYGNVIRYFSIFKEVNTMWNYVPDPVNDEYFASAVETLNHFSGDCDDHSILMVSLIKSIGGEARLVRTIGHIYPEVKVCHRRDLEKINMLIRDIFYEESKGKPIYFHADDDGYIWLNFDYTDRYPGGRFMNVKIIDIMNA